MGKIWICFCFVICMQMGWASERMGVVEIGGLEGIDQSTFLKVKLSLDEYQKEGVERVLLVLNTPGGEVFSTLKIIEAIKKFMADGGEVKCYVDGWAISAGALIAYACPEIIINKGSIMGAAEPVQAGADGAMQTSSEKVNSCLRAQIASLAALHGRDPLVAMAMVDKEMHLVKRDGKFVALGKGEGIEPGDVVIAGEDKLLTLTSEQLMEYGVADQRVDTRVQEAIGEFEGAYFSNWRLDFVRVLLNPIVSGILFTLLTVGIYMEMTTPGFGVMGGLSILSGSLILMASQALDMMPYMEMFLFAVGVALLFVELFLIPGFGVIGALGILLCFGSGLLMILPGVQLKEFVLPSHGGVQIPHVAYLDLLFHLKYVVIYTGLAIGLCYLFGRHFSGYFYERSPLVLRTTSGDVEGPDYPEWAFAGGEVMVAKTSLKPWGKAHFEGREYDVVCAGGYADAGSRLSVVKVERNKIFVRKEK